MSLEEYRRKRDFGKTGEPPPERGSGGRRRFVIQKHDATRLHYDFRLEMSGTLKSWAVPKGLPFKKGEKHLAVQTEDHPVSYIDFEGTIPKGQYGGGTVMVWDRGTYEPLSQAPAKELAGGKLHFILSGKKLHGEWYLVRLREENQWLLIKGGEDMAPVSAKLDDTSVLSSKSMRQLAQSDRVWQSKRPEKAGSKSGSRGAISKAVPAPHFIPPMMAKLAAAPMKGDWLYEIKFDGFRALALKGSGGAVQLLSRNEKDLGSKFPEVVNAVANLEVDNAIIDGEIVALDSEGRSSFQLLQAYEMGEKRPPIFFYAFDALRSGGRDLRGLPIEERKAALEKMIGAPGVIRYSAALAGDVRKLLKQIDDLGLEGLIGKQRGSVYEAGRRSGAWIKIKLRCEQEFVIGGHSEPSGSRKRFGAVLVGAYEGSKLMFAGKVGTGFTEAALEDLFARFSKLARGTCPFADLPEKRPGRYGKGVVASEMKRCHWVEPRLVCQVEFTEWTRDGRLRQPVFLGIREDKDPEEVVREKQPP